MPLTASEEESDHKIRVRRRVSYNLSQYILQTGKFWRREVAGGFLTR
jgi:hypothetical protein